jgi:hypothetical protein
MRIVYMDCSVSSRVAVKYFFVLERYVFVRGVKYLKRHELRFSKTSNPRADSLQSFMTSICICTDFDNLYDSLS